MTYETIWTLETFRWSDVPDILVVAAIIFVATLLMRGTQAAPLLRGTILVAADRVLFHRDGLIAFRWLLSNMLMVILIAIPVIFQPELRRGLERIGRTGFSVLFNRTPTFTDDEADHRRHLRGGGARLSERRHGALVVLERSDPLDEFINTGVALDSEVSPQLFLTIFWPKTELHDGAVIIRKGRVASAASVLPLSSGRNLSDRKLGTRHRAGLGISEVSDALCVIISEETGRISVANRGRMIRRLDANRLRTILSAFYTSARPQSETAWPWSSLLARAREEIERRRQGGDQGSGRRAA